MRKLYLLSFAKTKKDTPRTGTLFYTQFTSLEGNDWVLTSENSVSSLSRDEQLAHIDTLLSIMCIPGNQEDDVGMNFDATTAVPLTDRVAIGVVDSVKELHTLKLSPESRIIEATMTDPDERRFVQKDFVSAVDRLFKDYRKFDSPADIYAIQKQVTRPTTKKAKVAQ